MSDYTSELPQEAWDALLDKLAEGKNSLVAICQMEGMPARRTVYDRIERDEEFASRFRVRRTIGVRAIVDDCLEIADEEVKSELDVKNKRVRIDTRLRLAGKWLPAEFGERLDVVSSDGTMSPPRTLAEFYGKKAGE